LACGELLELKSPEQLQSAVEAAAATLERHLAAEVACGSLSVSLADAGYKGTQALASPAPV
jgi:hypothetical protein